MKVQWKEEYIPDEAILYRTIHNGQISNKRIPSESQFSIRKGGIDGLSTNWNKYATPEESLAILGRQYRPNTTEPKDPNNFSVYSLEVAFVRKLQDVKEVKHDPIFEKNPPIGKPNNRAHSLIIFNIENDPEVRVKLRDHAQDRKVNVDMKKVELLLQKKN